MIRRKLYSILLIPMLMTLGCKQAYDFIPDSAGDNKSTLINVLNSCRQDSDSNKYKAAEFLIRHMGWHISQENDGVYPDASLLTYEFLTDQIKHAILQWQNSPYAQDLSFEEFCEYLLPYRAAYGFGHNISGKERYDWVEEHIGLPDSITDIKELIKHYNYSIHVLREKGGKRNVHYRDGLNDLLYNDYTDCADKAVQTCLNLRAIGVPCVVEHNLGYRTFKAHHYHCAVWDTHSKEWIRFDAEGIRDYPGEGDWTSAELLNVYRETYAPQADAPYKEGEKMPHGFASPCQKDVTHHTIKIEVPVETELTEQVPYLATFHRSETGLQPFTYGHIEDGKAIFEHVVPSVWYVVAVYPQGEQKIISRPFWVNEATDGVASISYAADFNPNDGQTEDITLYRKYPIKDKLVKRARTLIGTTIKGANKPDFSDAQILWVLDSLPHPKVVNYQFKASGNYSFYRLHTPKACEVSVLQWLTENEEIQPSSTNKVYDGDMTTAPTDSTSITLSLSEPQRIIGINLAPINADNAVTPGHIYQLYVWKDYQGWVLHSTQRASADSIKFSGVTKHAMLWLKDTTKGQEEMPMFYEQGNQRFIYSNVKLDHELLVSQIQNPNNQSL